jgi:hypothetical protein
MPTCVYCGFTDEEEFPREHVIPVFLGSFESSLTLGCVCGECNDYFGKHLEREFARESAESIVRYRYRLRDARSAERTRKIRAKVNVPGPTLGAKVLLHPDASAKSGIGNKYVPQVAIRNKNDHEWRWYTVEDLNSDVVQTLEPGSTMKFLVTSPEEEEAIRSRLRELGLGPTKTITRDQIQPQSEMKTRVTCGFDFNMSRCVAKLAFNYLAHVLEENTSRLLQPEFDAVRDYVRYGSNPAQPIVYFSEKPDFEQENSSCSFVDGHILAVGWDATNENIGCALSLFNAMTYRVVLCRRYGALWFPLKSAHSFDFRTNEAKGIPVSVLA